MSSAQHSVDRKFPWQGLTLVSVIATCAVAAVAAREPGIFGPYFGTLPPWPTAALICITGILTLRTLTNRWSFKVFDPDISGFTRFKAAFWAVPFMVAVTAADLQLGFPADINVPPPVAFVLYPVMGFIAQIILHIVPLTIILAVTSLLLRRWSGARQIGLAIGLTATLEAIFQIPSGGSAASSGLAAFVFLHLLAFGVVELLIFRRYDYLGMYTFRLTYYAYWHLLWGYLRLI